MTLTKLLVRAIIKMIFCCTHLTFLLTIEGIIIAVEVKEARDELRPHLT